MEMEGRTLPRLRAENHLADRHYVSVVIRLMLDRRGRMVHGELVGSANTRPTRFSDWDGLTHALQAWLKQHEQDDPADEPEAP